MLEKNHEHVR